jgi:hypothetical protein
LQICVSTENVLERTKSLPIVRGLSGKKAHFLSFNIAEVIDYEWCPHQALNLKLSHPQLRSATLQPMSSRCGYLNYGGIDIGCNAFLGHQFKRLQKESGLWPMIAIQSRGVLEQRKNPSMAGKKLGV